MTTSQRIVALGLLLMLAHTAVPQTVARSEPEALAIYWLPPDGGLFPKQSAVIGIGYRCIRGGKVTQPPELPSQSGELVFDWPKGAQDELVRQMALCSSPEVKIQGVVTAGESAKPGLQKLPGIQASIRTAAVGRRAFAAIKLYDFSAAEASVNIRSVPQDWPASAPWIVAESIKAELSLSQLQDLRVHDQVWVQVRIHTKGLKEEWTPVPRVLASGLDILNRTTPSQNTLSETGEIPQVETLMTLEAVVEEGADIYSIRFLPLFWRDAASDQTRTLQLPEQVLKVVKVASAKETTEPSVPVTQTGQTGAFDIADRIPVPAVANPDALNVSPPWQNWLANALIAILMMLWLRAEWLLRRGGKTANTASDLTADLKKAANELRSACRQNHPVLVRSKLLEWARLRHQSRNISLDELARHYQDPQLVQAIKDLNAACYSRQGNQSNWRANALSAALVKITESS